MYSLYTTQIDYIMRLCLITDSHGKEMDDYIRQIDPSVEVFSIIRGSNMSVIYQTYLGSISELRVFSPDVIILHMAHNNLLFHPVKNRYPTPMNEVVQKTEDFVAHIKSTMPGVAVSVSCMFPRTVTNQSLAAAYPFGENDRVSFNEMAMRYREKISDRRRGLTVIFNKMMWKGQKARKEDTSLYGTDGLHLNPVGKQTVAMEWLAHARGVMSQE